MCLLGRGSILGFELENQVEWQACFLLLANLVVTQQRATKPLLCACLSLSEVWGRQGGLKHTPSRGP